MPLLLGSWGAKVERAAREFDGWLASAYRRTADQIIAAHERYRAAGGRRAIVCAIPLSGKDDLGPTGELLQRYAEAGFDDAVVLIQPGGPDPKQVRALPREPSGSWPSRRVPSRLRRGPNQVQSQPSAHRPGSGARRTGDNSWACPDGGSTDLGPNATARRPPSMLVIDALTAGCAP